MIQIGTGLKEVEDMPRILEGKDRELAGPTAPPEGLTLIHISYND